MGANFVGLRQTHIVCCLGFKRSFHGMVTIAYAPCIRLEICEVIRLTRSITAPKCRKFEAQCFNAASTLAHGSATKKHMTCQKTRVRHRENGALAEFTGFEDVSHNALLTGSFVKYPMTFFMLAFTGGGRSAEPILRILF